MAKKKGIEKIKSRYGYRFVIPWGIGILLFFIIPLIKSIIFSFSNVSVETGALRLENVGFENYRYILFDDPVYTANLPAAIKSFLTIFPIVLILSLALALLLNGKYKGRTFFRSIYFLPVIIASGVVLEHILYTMNGDDVVMSGVSDSMASSMIDIDSLIKRVGLPEKLVGFLSDAISSIFDTIWKCGIPIVLFIAGLQTIPDSLYEVSKVEGATKWEEFWFITIPMLSRVLLLVSVYISVDIMTEKSNVIMSEAYNQMSLLEYGLSGAMLWFYFILVGAVIGVVMLIYNRLCIKRWS